MKIPGLITGVVLSVLTCEVSGQIVSSDSTLSLSGLVEACYVFDFDHPATNTRPPFLYNHTRTNEISANLAFIKVRYADQLARGNLALMTGTYAQANLAAEPPIWRNVLEANAGVRLHESANLWLDAGIFSSHIGFESAIGKDNWTLTRSIMAENSPYYESGARVAYITAENSWTLCAHVLNGWQVIQRAPGHSGLSWGTQIIFQPNPNVLLNSSTFIGNTKPDSVRQVRLFHNFYGVFSLTSTLGLIVAFDVGAERATAGRKTRLVWYSPVAVVRYLVNRSLSVAARIEYYHDRDEVIIPTGTPNGFQVLGGSLNLDYALSKNALWRIEVRLLQSVDAIFPKAGEFRTRNISFASSLSVSF